MAGAAAHPRIPHRESPGAGMTRLKPRYATLEFAASLLDRCLREPGTCITIDNLLLGRSDKGLLLIYFERGVRIVDRRTFQTAETVLRFLDTPAGRKLLKQAKGGVK
jgi:hypothetical protein